MKKVALFNNLITHSENFRNAVKPQTSRAVFRG